MRLIKIFLYILPSILASNVFAHDLKKCNVLVCYGKLNPETIKGYSYVILESKYYLPSDIRVIKSQNEKVFAYISLGEVNASATHYDILKEYTLGKNETWDSYYLNLKSEKTIKTLLNVIDQTFLIGYDGLFLDNIDNFTSNGPQNAQKIELVNLLSSIKEKYFEKEFIQNAGLELISETSPYINAIAVESVASNYTFKNNNYKLRNRKEFDVYMTQIKKINETYKIPIILIEYADSNKLYSEIEERFKSSQFNYFIGNIDLQNSPKFKK